MAADFGPCADWPVYWTCDVSTYSPVLTGLAVSAATRILWSLSGRRFGQCTVALRPCAEDCLRQEWAGSYGYWDWPTGYTMPPWDWYSVPYSCGSCAGDCSHGVVPEIRLPAPVSSVVSVKVDGSPLVTGAYRLDNSRILVRTDGQKWPRFNELIKDDTQAGTWSVTAVYGESVPVSGQMAMGEMACELLKAASGEDCRLPPGVTSLVRQGVTIQYPDIGQLLKEGRTGLYLVDLFLASENPHHLVSRGRVYSVDGPRTRRTNT